MSARAPFGRSASNTLLEASDNLVDGVDVPVDPTSAASVDMPRVEPFCVPAEH